MIGLQAKKEVKDTMLWSTDEDGLIKSSRWQANGQSNPAEEL
jgi:hypothetical protein